MLTKRLPNETITYHTYDAAARLSSLENRKSDGTAICTFEFGRDSNGNILTSLREDDSCWYYEYVGEYLSLINQQTGKSYVGNYWILKFTE